MTWWCSGGDTVTLILPSIDSGGGGDTVNPFLFSSIDSGDGCGDTVGVIFLLY